MELGVAIRTEDYAGVDPVGFAISSLPYRGMNKSQIAICGVRWKEIEARMAKERQGKRNDLVEDVPPCSDNGKARDLAGKKLGVSGRLIDEAEIVIKNGSPEVITAVRDGKMAINTAVRIVNSIPNKKDQLHYVTLGNSRAISKQLESRARRSSGVKAGKKKSMSARLEENLVSKEDIVNTTLFRLELFAKDIAKTGLTPSQFAERFIRELDSRDAVVANRLHNCIPAIDVASQLVVMVRKYAKAG
jgi:hypothetical protein